MSVPKSLLVGLSKTAVDPDVAVAGIGPVPPPAGNVTDISVRSVSPTMRGTPKLSSS